MEILPLSVNQITHRHILECPTTTNRSEDLLEIPRILTPSFVDIETARQHLR